MAEHPAQQERARRSGGVKVVREGVWRVDVEVPHAHGQPRRRRSRTVIGTLADAEQTLVELRAEVTTRPVVLRHPRDGTTADESRRRRGSGGLTQRGPDRWLVAVDGPSDPVTGKRRRYTRTVRGSRRDAEVALARLRIDINTGERVVATNARTVRAACDLYLADARTERTTLRTDRSACNRLCSTQLPDGSEFGDTALSRLDWKTIEHVYAVWEQALQAQARARYASALSKVLEYAKRSGWISSNPAREARRPRVPGHRPDVPTEREVRQALKAAKTNDPTIYAVVMGLATMGCRRSELLALRLSDLDLEARVVTIRAALADGGPGTGIYYKTTKRNDWRDVPITDQMAEVFADLLEIRATAGHGEIANDPNSYVFSDAIDGSTCLRPDTTTHRWLSARGDSGVTFAMLRRYVATQLLDVTNGDYRTVASITGNSAETLRRWYDAGPNLEKKKAVVGLARL